MIAKLSCCILLVSGAFAALECSTTITPTNSIKPSVASGYRAALVATGLTKPRSIKFDTLGNLLVVESGKGITSLVFRDDNNTCLSVRSNKRVIQNSDLNHGLALSPDGKLLYASSAEAAYSWNYDPKNASIVGQRSTLVTGMNNTDHTTRTLLLSRKVDGTLVISRGSASNIDIEAGLLSSGHSQVKAFDLKDIPSDGFDFTTAGQRLGWGLRNSVGLAEHPDTGGIFSVENSADEIERDGINIHQDNPGEEMNFHGYLNGTEYTTQGSNYGYPHCVAAWRVDDIPQNTNLEVGSQFTIGDQNNTINDTFCAAQTPPILTFQAHMAPLDIVFNNSATEAWITFHGSWNRDDPVGYKLAIVPFENGNPVANPTNQSALIDIFANSENSVCPQNCFRPVGIAFDDKGRLFMSSDTTGEIYVVVKEQIANNITGITSSNPSSTSQSSRYGAEKRIQLKLGVLIVTSIVIGLGL